MEDVSKTVIENFKKKFSIDLAVYKNEEIAVKIGQLIVFPEFVIKNLLLGLAIGFCCYVLSFFVLNLSLASGLMFVLLGLIFWAITGFFLGLNVFLWNLKSNLSEVIFYGFDLTATVINDVQRQGAELRKKDVFELFQGIFSVVFLPSLADAILARVPVVGSLINKLVQKILNRMVKKINFTSIEGEEEAEDSPVSSEGSQLEAIIEKTKVQSVRLLKKSVGFIQFPFQVLFFISALFTLFLTAVLF